MGYFRLILKDPAYIRAEVEGWFREVERRLSDSVDSLLVQAQAAGLLGPADWRVPGVENQRLAPASVLPLPLRPPSCERVSQLKPWGFEEPPDDTTLPLSSMTNIRHPRISFEEPPDDTTLPQPDWDAKVEAVLADCAAWHQKTAHVLCDG